MGKSLFAFLLSFAIGIQPFALYPMPAYAQDKKATPPEVPSELLTILAKVRDLKSNYIRNKVYGETPGAKPELVPSQSQIMALDQELQKFKEKFFSETLDTLSNPAIVADRDPKDPPREWTDLILFYAIAADLEDLKTMSGTPPDPSVWEKKYGFEIPIDRIYLMSFIQHVGLHNQKMDFNRAAEWVFLAQLNNEDSSYKFTLNPILATMMVQNTFDAKSDKEQMLRIAQMMAADQLYTSQVLANDLTNAYLPLPEINPVLKEKFPILESRRSNFEIIRNLKYQRAMIYELAEKRVGALVEKLNKEQRFLMNMETMKKILNVVDPEKAKGSDEDIQKYVDAALKDEKELPMILTLQTILFSTKFDPAQSKAFWKNNLKISIAQAKYAVVTELILNNPGISEVERESVRKILQIRAFEFSKQEMANFDIDLVLKHIKSTQTLFQESRAEFDKHLWQAAREMENELAIDNSNVDLTIIADPEFVELLNSSINKVEKQIQINVDPLNSNAIATHTYYSSTNLKPLTVQWLQGIFQPNESYASHRVNYLKLLYSSLAEFNSGQPDPNLAFGNKVFGPSIKAIEAWLMAGTYNDKAVLIDNDPLNFLAIDLKNKAPASRKQELIELIKIAMNIGFFDESLPENPKVRDLKWGADWKRAYQAVKRKRIIAQNPILAMKMIDTDKESWWSSVIYAAPRVLGYQKDGQTFAEELSATNDQKAQSALVSTYLDKLKNLIQKNLNYLTTVETVELGAEWNSPSTWRNLFFKNPKPEFTHEFRKILSYSSILVAKLTQYTRFQMIYQRMIDELAEGDVYGKAYDKIYNFYVLNAFFALLGWGILKGVLRYGPYVKHTKAYEISKAIETEALTPILGPNLSYYTWTAMGWMTIEAIGNGIDTFGYERGLRNQISDLALSSAIGPGLIDMKTKIKYGDGGYDNARSHWWTTDGLMVLLGGGLLFGLPAYYAASKAVKASKTDVWAKKMLKLYDDVGAQAKRDDGAPIIGALKGDIDGNAIASKKEIVRRFEAAQKRNDYGLSWVNVDFFKLHIEQARLGLHAEMDALAVEWLNYGRQFAHQFKTLEMKPGRWDIQLFMQRQKDILKSLKEGDISREQYWVLKQNLNELTQFLSQYLDTLKKYPGLQEAVVEKLASLTSKMQFDEAGRLVKLDKDAIPEVWRQVTQDQIKQFKKSADDALAELIQSRATNMYLDFSQNYKGVAKVDRIRPTIKNTDGTVKEIEFYNMLERRPLQEEYLRGLAR